MKVHFSSAHFTLTKQCNLNCAYCYVHQRPEGVMSRETIQNGVKFLTDGAIKNNEKSVMIGFFGGEPTLCVDQMNYLFDYAYTYMEEIKLTKGIEITPIFNLTTNGMNWTPQLETFLTKWFKKTGKLHVQVSFDGPPELEAKQRPMKNGENSGAVMEETLKHISRWCEENRTTIRENFCVHSVVTRSSLPHLYELYSYFMNLGFPVWHLLLPEERWTQKDADFYKEQLLKIKDFVFLENDPALLYMSKSFQKLNPNCGPTCGAGLNFCNIAPNGRIYACHRIAEANEEDYLGILNEDGSYTINEDKKSVYEDLDSKEFLGVQRCGDCPNAQWCYRCIAANMEENILPSLCFPAYCEMLKAEIPIQNDLQREFRERGMIPNEGNSTSQNNTSHSCECNSGEELQEIREVITRLVDGISDTHITIADGLNTLQKEMEAIRITQNDILNLILGLLLKQEDKNG